MFIKLVCRINPYQYAPNSLSWIDPLGLTSCQLAEALIAAGESRPKDSAAHHIVPETAKGAQPARDILKKHDIDINSAVNGVFLPTQDNKGGSGIVHNGKHPNKYIDAINTRIIAADEKGGKQGVLKELEIIKETLKNPGEDKSWYNIL